MCVFPLIVAYQITVLANSLSIGGLFVLASFSKFRSLRDGFAGAVNIVCMSNMVLLYCIPLAMAILMGG